MSATATNATTPADVRADLQKLLKLAQAVISAEARLEAYAERLWERDGDRFDERMNAAGLNGNLSHVVLEAVNGACVEALNASGSLRHLRAAEGAGGAGRSRRVRVRHTPGGSRRGVGGGGVVSGDSLRCLRAVVEELEEKGRLSARRRRLSGCAASTANSWPAGNQWFPGRTLNLIRGGKADDDA